MSGLLNENSIGVTMKKEERKMALREILHILDNAPSSPEIELAKEKVISMLARHGLFCIPADSKVD